MSMKLNSVQIPFKQDMIQKSAQAPVKADLGVIDENTDKVKDNKLTLTLAALGAVGAGVLAATLAYKKGQTSGLTKVIKKSEESAKTALSQALSESKNLDIGLFKKIGNFEKGKAFINGKGFTGNIHTNNAVITYENGILKKSSIQKYNDKTLKIYKENGVNIFSNRSIKAIDKNSDGIIVRTINKIHNGNTEHDKQFVDYIKPDGSVKKTSVEYKDITFPKTKRTTHAKVTTDRDTDKIISIEKRDFSMPPSVRYKKQVVIDGKKVTQVFNDGKLSHTFTSEYNPKTGVLKRIEQGYDTHGNPYEGHHIKLIKFKTDGKTRIQDSVLTAFVEKDGKIKDGSIFITTFEKGEIAGHAYGNQGTTVEKAKEAIKEYNLPFEI